MLRSVAEFSSRRWQELTAPATAPRHDGWDWLALGLLSLCFTMLFQLGVPLRASYGARITGDEPFYLLTTESLLADGDLDLTNQYAQQSYLRFFDGAEPLWYQSEPSTSGALLSPHNLGLSVLVLPAYAVGGVDGVKALLGLLAGLTLGWTYLLSRRVTGHRRASVLAVGLLGVAAPWFVYATQIYPEAPAALVVVILVWWILGPRRSGWAGVIPAALMIVMLWLGSKYAPLAGVLAMLAFMRLDRAGRLVFSTALATLGLHYALTHLLTYGGLTPYSVNRLYAGSSTLELVELHFELGNRLYRLLGLWVDREFGVLRWAPALALAAPGAWLVSIRARSSRWVILMPFAAQLLVTTFLAITMRGWWFPGRMLVVVLPLLAPLMAMALAWIGVHRIGQMLSMGLAAATIETTWRLWRSARELQVTLSVNPFETHGAWLDGTTPLFPLYTEYGLDTMLLSVLWALLLAAFASGPSWARRTGRLVRPADPSQPARVSS